MLADSSIQSIRQFWGAFLGVDDHHLDTQQVVLVPQFFEDDQDTVYVFRRLVDDPHRGVVVSVVADKPAETLNLAAAAIGDLGPGGVFTRDLWGEAFCGRIDRLAGPTWVGYADEKTFDFVGSSGARVLEVGDRAALVALGKAVGEAAWEASGLELDMEPLFGVFEEDGLVAVAGVENWGRVIANVAYAAVPGREDDGGALACAKAAGRYALTQGAVLQFRTPPCQEAARAMAEVLGFQPWAETISVRLKQRPARRVY